MARTKRGARTAEEILESARIHLLEAGLEGFSLREVARRAELAPSALYNHFPNKDALINQLAMEAIGSLGEYLEKVPADLPASERLLGLSKEYLRFASEQPERYRLVFDMLTSPTPAWIRFQEVAYPFNLIVRAAQAGLETDELHDPENVGASGIAYGLWALVHGFVMLSAHHLARVEDDLTPFRLASIRSYILGLTTAAA